MASSIGLNSAHFFTHIDTHIKRHTQPCIGHGLPMASQEGPTVLTCTLLTGFGKHY